jgi:hypothetical protein
MKRDFWKGLTAIVWIAACLWGIKVLHTKHAKLETTRRERPASEEPIFRPETPFEAGIIWALLRVWVERAVTHERRE